MFKFLNTLCRVTFQIQNKYLILFFSLLIITLNFLNIITVLSDFQLGFLFSVCFLSNHVSMRLQEVSNHNTTCIYKIWYLP